MDGIRRAWDRYQWVGAPAGAAPTNTGPTDDIEAWNLSQWLGAPSSSGPPRTVGARQHRHLNRLQWLWPLG